jgi:mannose-1-phosphate guanylyltransferase
MNRGLRTSRQSLDRAATIGDAVRRPSRWGVVLAGGDGSRLRHLTEFICGDNRPKQFCPLLDGHTLLTHTIRRAERNVPTGQILIALTRAHREFYLHELDVSPTQRIVQPCNKGTAPPILFSFLSIEQMDKDALVAILPSDHHYSDEERFSAALESAFEIANQHTQSVVLLGAQPDRPEVEYGWIELGATVGRDCSELHTVRRFREKPTLEVAQDLLGRQSVWNTFVMVGKVRALLDMISEAVPDALEALRPAQLWTGSERYIEESVYDRLPSIDFSRQVLSAATTRLLVLRVRDLGWNDLGHSGRVLAILEENGSNPEWMTHWIDAKQPPGTARPGLKSAVA